MTGHTRDDLVSNPVTGIKDKNLQNLAVSSIGSNNIDVLPKQAVNNPVRDREFSIESKNTITAVVSFNSNLTDNGGAGGCLCITDLVQCFDALWPSEESAENPITDSTSEINSNISNVKVIYEGEAK